MRFVARRGFFYVLTLWVAVTINFFIPRLMPGNPVEGLFSRLRVQASPGKIHAFEIAFGLNTHQSLLSQYWSYLGNICRGDLGVSITYFPSSVTSVIGTALPWTIGLLGIATILSFFIGTGLGILAAWKRGSATAEAIVPITTLLSAIPYFWLGLIALTVFSVELHWLPLNGGSSPDIPTGFTWSFVGTVIVHGILPALTIVVTSIAAYVLNMRNSMVATMSEDYVLLAEAKGLRARRVVLAYAARNAILPNIASFAMSIGVVVGGAVLTEIVFSYPGIGNVLFQAVSNEDYPLMQGIFLIITVMVLLANLLADVAYVLLDPRTRSRRS